MDPLSARYLAVQPLLLRYWPGETTAVVYSAETATTHLVSAWGFTVLDAAARGPLSGRELASLLEPTPNPVDAETGLGAVDLQQLAESIDGLVSAGLLRIAA
jgi:hypothetical protein